MVWRSISMVGLDEGLRENGFRLLLGGFMNCYYFVNEFVVLGFGCG